MESGLRPRVLANHAMVAMPAHVPAVFEVHYTMKRLALYLSEPGLACDQLIVSPATLDGVTVPVWLPVCMKQDDTETQLRLSALHVMLPHMMDESTLFGTGMKTASGITHVKTAISKSLAIPRAPIPNGMYVFRNGVLDLKDMSFTPLHEYVMQDSHAALRYFDMDFQSEMLTRIVEVPDLERIMQDQKWSPETCLAFKAFIGRLAFPLRSMDRWDAVMACVGQAGAGKTTIVDAAMHAFYANSDIGTAGNAPPNGFQFQSIYNKRIVHFSDIDKSFLRNWDTGDLKTIVSGENLTVNIKYEKPVWMQWRAPVVFTSNEKISWPADRGGMARRVVYFSYDHRPANVDTDILNRLMEPENQVAFIINTVRCYHEMRHRIGNATFASKIDDVYPDHARVQEDVFMEDDAVAQFVQAVYEKGGDEDYVSKIDILRDMAGFNLQYENFQRVCTYTNQLWGTQWYNATRYKSSALAKAAFLQGKQLVRASQGIIVGMKYQPVESDPVLAASNPSNWEDASTNPFAT